METASPASAHRGVIGALDGLRGLAAIGILLLHVPGRFGFAGWPGRLHLAVPLFFVISGYVIDRAYQHRLLAGMSLARFAAIRAIRLYPMLALSCLLAVLAGFPADRVAMVALLIPTVSGAIELFPANGPVWSLFIEIWGNAFHALFVRQLTPRILGALIAIGAFGTVMTTHSVGNLCVGWGNGNFSGGVAIFCSSYFTGVGIHRTERAGWLPALPRLPFWAPALAYALAVGVPMPAGWRGEGWVEVVLVLVLFPLTVLLATRASPSERTARLCRWLGNLSYPLYVLHYPIVSALGQYARGGLPPAARALEAAAVAVACIAAAHILFHLYDMPVRARAGAWLRRRPDRPAEPRAITL